MADPLGSFFDSLGFSGFPGFPGSEDEGSFVTRMRGDPPADGFGGYTWLSTTSLAEDPTAVPPPAQREYRRILPEFSSPESTPPARTARGPPAFGAVAPPPSRTPKRTYSSWFFSLPAAVLLSMRDALQEYNSRRARADRYVERQDPDPAVSVALRQARGDRAAVGNRYYYSYPGTGSGLFLVGARPTGQISSSAILESSSRFGRSNCPAIVLMLKTLSYAQTVLVTDPPFVPRSTYQRLGAGYGDVKQWDIFNPAFGPPRMSAWMVYPTIEDDKEQWHVKEDALINFEWSRPRGWVFLGDERGNKLIDFEFQYDSETRGRVLFDCNVKMTYRIVGDADDLAAMSEPWLHLFVAESFSWVSINRPVGKVPRLLNMDDLPEET